MINIHSMHWSLLIYHRSNLRRNKQPKPMKPSKEFWPTSTELSNTSSMARTNTLIDSIWRKRALVRNRLNSKMPLVLLLPPPLLRPPALDSRPAWVNKALLLASLPSVNQQRSPRSAKHLLLASLHSRVLVRLPLLVVVDQHSVNPRS